LNQLQQNGEECCTKDGSSLEIVKRKPKPSELAKESILSTRGLAFRRRLSGVVCKLPYAALGGNSLGGER
jgi:hypothetical protein